MISRWFVHLTPARWNMFIGVWALAQVVIRGVRKFDWLDVPFYLLVGFCIIGYVTTQWRLGNTVDVLREQQDVLRHQQRVIDNHHEFVMELHELNQRTVAGKVNLEHIGWGIQREEGFELLPIKRDSIPPFGAEPLYRLPTASKAVW